MERDLLKTLRLRQVFPECLFWVVLKNLLFYLSKTTYSRELWHCGVQRKKENCVCLCLSPQLISSKYGVMFNKPLQRKIRTSTQTQLHQYPISIQLGEKVQLIVKTLELWSRHESVT